MPYIIPADRQQLTFLNKLDDLVAGDHPVRLLDRLIDRIIAADPAYFDHLADDKGAGRRGYPAGCLIKLLLYGYINRISSSRALQREAERNSEVIWLLSTLTPSYKTIADYRKDYPGQIERVNQQVVRFLIDGGWIRGDRVAVDGTKLKAYTGWDIPDGPSLEARLQKAHEQLEAWLERLAETDALEAAEQERGEDATGGPGEPELMVQIERLHQHIQQLEAARQRLAASGAKQIPLSDPEARPMRAARGGKPPSYNLQVCTDSAHKLIVVATATNQPNDFEQLAGMHQAAADQYRCSAGRTLAVVSKGRYRPDKDSYIDTYRGTDCGGCPMQSDCTSAADGGRRLQVYHGAGWRHQYARQLASHYGKARIAERKGLVEHVFGTLRYWMG